MKVEAKSAEEDELSDLKLGLRFVEENELEKLEVETDGKRIRDMLKSEDDFSHHPLSPIIHDITHYMDNNMILELTHIPRRVNTVAHGLAMIGMVMNQMRMEYHTSPPSLKADYDVDLAAAEAELDARQLQDH